MLEETMYPIIKDHLEKMGYYPVKVTPSIRVKGYKPDVTGLKGKRIITVEAKPDFNERSLMEAVTQAKVYALGSTHAFIAFPNDKWISGHQNLKELCTSLCTMDGIGIYLVDMKNESLVENLGAPLSKFTNLDILEDTSKQLEGERTVTLTNTYPEYVRDVCLIIAKYNQSVSRIDLVQEMETLLDNGYWIAKPGHRSSSDVAAAENRRDGAIRGAIELGLVKKEVIKEGENDSEELSLTLSGRLLVDIAGTQINETQPELLDLQTNIFFSTYLLQFPVFQMAIETLEIEGKEMILDNSICPNCNEHHFTVKKFKQIKEELFCVKCNQPVALGLTHKLSIDFGEREYYEPLKFTKTLGDDPLLIFRFGSINRLTSISLRI